MEKYNYLFDLFKRRGDWDAMMEDANKVLRLLDIPIDESDNRYHEHHGVVSGIAMSYWARGYAAASGRNTEDCIKELLTK